MDNRHTGNQIGANFINLVSKAAENVRFHKILGMKLNYAPTSLNCIIILMDGKATSFKIEIIQMANMVYTTLLEKTDLLLNKNVTRVRVLSHDSMWEVGNKLIFGKSNFLLRTFFRT